MLFSGSGCRNLTGTLFLWMVGVLLFTGAVLCTFSLFMMHARDLKLGPLRKTGERLKGRRVYLEPPTARFLDLEILGPRQDIPLISTPVHTVNFLSALPHLPTGQLQWLQETLTKGAFVGFTGSRDRPSHRQNNASALAAPSVVDDLLAREVQQGFLLGPFTERPSFGGELVRHTNALTLHFKSKYRLCIDFSNDLRGTVNAGIHDGNASVDYDSIDKVVDDLFLSGPRSLIGKLDLADAFKIIPICVEDLPLMGIKWRGLHFVAVRLAFGLRSAARIFNSFSSAVVGIIDKWAATSPLPKVFVRELSLSSSSIHYLAEVFLIRNLLDDFIFLFAAHHNLADYTFDLIVNLFHYLGLPLNHKKTCRPATSQIIFGIGVDTLSWKFYVPEDKAVKALTILSSALATETLTLKSVQQVIGHLAFLARALVASRTFLRRLIDATLGATQPNFPIVLDGGARGDIEWWTTVLHLRDQFAMSLLHSSLVLPSDHELATDSSLFACGACFRSRWFSLEFPDCMRKVTNDIVVKELAVLALAILVWGCDLSGTRILVHCDNEAVNAIMRSGTSKNPVAMSLMRFLALECIQGDLFVSTAYIRSEDNTGPDLLSRMNVKNFLRFKDTADPSPTYVLDSWKSLFDSCLRSQYE